MAARLASLSTLAKNLLARSRSVPSASFRRVNLCQGRFIYNKVSQAVFDAAVRGGCRTGVRIFMLALKACGSLGKWLPIDWRGGLEIRKLTTPGARWRGSHSLGRQRALGRAAL